MGFACGCDPAEVYRASFQKARKEHLCVECGHVITPGQEYQRVFMVYEGDPSTHVFCERCSDLIEAFSDVGYCWGIGQFFEDYGDWLDEEPPKLNADGDPIPGAWRANAIRQKHRDWSPSSVGSDND